MYLFGDPLASRDLDGSMSMAATWERALTSRELMLLHEDPYLLWRPTNLPIIVATLATATTVQLDWTDVSEHEDGFSIERATDAGAFGEIDTVGVGIETYNNVNVPLGHTYHYRVRAISAALGYSEYSNEADVIV